MTAAAWKSLNILARFSRAATTLGPILLFVVFAPILIAVLANLQRNDGIPLNVIMLMAAGGVVAGQICYLILRRLSVQTQTLSDQQWSHATKTRAERPIISSKDDLLERSAFVRRLADALINPATGRATSVVIGVTGPWGSGKSSVLNLLAEHITSNNKNALVVRFDPWLVSGRDDLIFEFMRELLGTIRAEPETRKRMRAVTHTLTEYGIYLAPVTNLFKPGAGAALASGLSAIKMRLLADHSINALRARLMKEIAAVSVPIIVLVDELDRVEDAEIKAVAQLVRSVADFSGVSYVLAYDSLRVVQALGAGEPEDAREQRGRAYLEKIVQLQIPLPIMFDEEIRRMLEIELKALEDELNLPKNLMSMERFQTLLGILVPALISTPRDVSRLVGTFHALGGMLRGEVDWLDLLAYSALLIKAPQTAELMKLRPEEFCEELLSERATMHRVLEQEKSPEERLNSLIPNNEHKLGVKDLLEFLFPQFSDEGHRSDEPSDRLFRRRPILTTLRLSLLPGDYTQDDIMEVTSNSSFGVTEFLKSAYSGNRIRRFIDRLGDLYSETISKDHTQFWIGVDNFLRKPDCEWMTSYSTMHEIAHNFADILWYASNRSESMRPIAAKIFTALCELDGSILPSYWIRRLIFAHGLFRMEKRTDLVAFLDSEQTESIAKELSTNWRGQHLTGKLIPCRWDLMPVYTVIDVGLWDELCRSIVDEALLDDKTVDGLSLMLYGSFYSTEKSTVAKICTYDKYIERVKERLSSPNLDDSVRAALNKAERGFW